MHKNIIAFSGGGNMAAAIIGGLIKAGAISSDIRVSEPDEARRAWLKKEFNITPYQDNAEAVMNADGVVVAVKPSVVPKVLQAMAPHLAPETLILSIAAGVTLAQLTAHLPTKQPVIRCMPNTPALIGEGMTAFYADPETVSEKHRALAGRLLGAIGDVVALESESQLDAVTAISASGPAYLFLMAEALSDGGVACGLPRSLADRLTVRMLLGSAQLLLKTGALPAQLKNRVTSPAGTTIAALSVLEKAAVRGAFMDAVKAAWSRSRELG